MTIIWFVWRSSRTRSLDATTATLQELNPELIFDFHRKTPQNHTLTMSAEAEKAPEVAKKEEEKTSEELKATKRAAEVSKSVLRPSRAFPQKSRSVSISKEFGRNLVLFPTSKSAYP